MTKKLQDVNRVSPRLLVYSVSCGRFNGKNRNLLTKKGRRLPCTC